MIGVLVSGTGTNLQALLDAGLPVVAVASNRRDAAALARAGTLPTAAFDRFPDAVVNVHPSLLPEFPGARAVEEQLAAGIAESGATVHLVDDGVDSGPILAQERVPVLSGDTAETLHARIKEIEHRLLPRVVEELCAR